MQDVPQRRGPNKPASKNLLNDVFFKYLPYWPLFIITLVIAVAGGWFYLRTAIPQYETNASIMLKDESKGAYEGMTINALDKVSDKKIIENELKVIQSRTLMHDVVKRLHLYASFFEEGDVIALPAYVTSPVTIEATDPEALKSAEKVPFTFNAKDSSVMMNGKKYELNKFADTEYGNIRFVRNKNFMYPATKPLFFSIMKAKAASESFAGVHAILGRETTLISLSYTGPDPKRGEDLLNELIRAYDRANIDEKNRLAANTESFVRERLDSVQKELDEINQRKQSYKASRGAVNISSQGELFLKTVNETDQKVSDVNLQLSVLNQVEKYVKSKDNAGGIVPSTLGVKDPMLSKLVEDLYDTEINYEKLKKTSGKN